MACEVAIFATTKDIPGGDEVLDIVGWWRVKSRIIRGEPSFCKLGLGFLLGVFSSRKYHRESLREIWGRPPRVCNFNWCQVGVGNSDDRRRSGHVISGLANDDCETNGPFAMGKYRNCCPLVNIGFATVDFRLNS